jgi:hypothetical protein
MGEKLPPSQLALYRAIDEIVWTDWDPICVSQLQDWPRDEYYDYLPRIFSVASRGDRMELARVLADLYLHIAGHGVSVESQLGVADSILAARARCVEPADYGDEA